MAVVYRHRRLDTNEIFYIGIGKSEKRAYEKGKRNKHWKNIVNKCGYTVEVIVNNIDWEEAKEFEKSLIFLYGREDLGTGNLVNKTEGGEGVIGLIRTEEHRRKIIESNTGKKRSKEFIAELKSRRYSDEVKYRMSKAHIGHKASEETKKKMSETRKGMKHSEESRKKMSESSKGKSKSKESREKMSKSKTGLRLKKLFKSVLQFDLNGKYIKTFESITDAQLEVGKRIGISEVCSGKRKTAGGYIWKYKDEINN